MCFWTSLSLTLLFVIDPLPNVFSTADVFVLYSDLETVTCFTHFRHYFCLIKCIDASPHSPVLLLVVYLIVSVFISVCGRCSSWIMIDSHNDDGVRGPSFPRVSLRCRYSMILRTSAMIGLVWPTRAVTLFWFRLDQFTFLFYWLK